MALGSSESRSRLKRALKVTVSNNTKVSSGIMEAKRRQGIAVVEAKVAVAIGIGKRDDAFATESAVGVHQIGEALVCNLRLYGVFHRFLAGAYHQQEGT